MKIVINACFGGFRLSTEAMRRLIEKGCRAVKSTTVDEYTGGEGFSGYDKHDKDAGNGFSVGWIPDVLDKDGVVYSYEDHNRTDPDLVAVVEEMGAMANSECAELKVIEIPDGIKYEIDEYDGLESIHEEHRSWS